MKSIRLGIIGCGGFVRYHVKAINEHVRQLKISALCDIIPQKCGKLDAEMLGGKGLPVYKDYRKMLRDEKLDAVIVSTPHTLHYQMAYDAIGAGLHVMVEKPMVTDSTQARKLVRRAKAKARTLNIAVQGVHTGTFAYARKLINDGTLGPLQLVQGNLVQAWLEPCRGLWRQVLEQSGGGQLYDSMAHVFTAMLYLVNSPVKEVFCWADYKDVPVDINAVGTIKFANGCLGSLTCGGNCNAWLSQVQVQCAHAMMHISAHGGDFHVTGRPLKKDITDVPKGWKLPTVSPARNFADCILGKAKPRCDGRLGIIVADLMDGLYESIQTGRPARITKRVPVEG